MRVEDLGQMHYRSAWAVQERVHAEVLAGGDERLLLVEHPPVITFGRRDGGEVNLIAAPDQLAKMGVELVKSDRGGDITFHGPGQIVAYPIIRLNDRKFSVGAYVHALEEAVIAMLAELGVAAKADRSAVGVWVEDAKVCAIGVRISRGVSLHGLALNVETDLRYFNLIVPCGLPGRRVTSVRELLGEAAPSLETARVRLADHLLRRLDVGSTCPAERGRGR
jgi:lipoate-protein ligase B